ncbi:IQ domain-containing protein E isoform X2 [Nerophis ophidion]|uniref:IQ domain-containing protein E isoform X2 n=1 Tax=Nerophis ophidion TaxID=159077 RepID=UPI002ADF2AE2|nr:IQ domain-containing protein E isoform X2 [Nerophis ophidion]
MSVGVSDVPTDEDCEVLPEDGSLYSSDFVKKTPKRRSGKPPPSFRSPYLTSLHANPKRAASAAVAAWRLPRPSLCDTPRETGSARLTSHSNQHDQRSELDLTPDFPRHTFPTRKYFHSASNGVSVRRDREDMHDELTLLKKSLHEQKSDNQKMKAKIRRLEEDNTKRERQLEELLDPTKKSEYTRSLVDRKHEGSVVLNGLKQRVLKLEQQCREKENTIGKLQNELRATNLEEMRMTLKNYYEEVQRLRILLDASEKSGLADSKVFRRQQKALSSTILRLSENLKQIQLENAALRQELDTESPSVGVKGYKEWSKYRLLRRLLELEKKLEESTRRAKHLNQASQTTLPGILHQASQTIPTGFLNHGSQTTPKGILDLAVQTTHTETLDTETMTEVDEVAELRERVEQLEAERAQLQEWLSSGEEEVRQLRKAREEESERVKDEKQQYINEVEQLKTEKEELEQRLERWKVEQTNEREIDRRQHEEERQQLKTEREHLEKECERLEQEVKAERQQHEEELRQLKIQALENKREPCDAGLTAASRKEDDDEEEEIEEEEEEYDCLRKYRNEAGDSTNPSDGQLLDEVSLTTIQSAFRGHLARSQHITESSGSFKSSASKDILPPMASKGAPSQGAASGKHQAQDEDLCPVSRTHASVKTTPEAQPQSVCAAELVAGDEALSRESDDSDDIIIAESYPRRNRETRVA